MSDSEETPSFGGSTVSDAEAVALTGEAAAPEAPVEPEKPVEPETPKQDERFAAKFAALSRKEKAMRAQEAKLAQQAQEMQQKIAEFEAKMQEMEKYKSGYERVKREPFKVLEEQGLTREQIAELFLNDGKPSQEMLLTEAEKKINAKIEEMERKLAEKEAKEAKDREEAALSAFKAQLTDFINADPSYELIKANDAVDMVYEVIEQHHAETGEILSNKEASDVVEEYLLEEAKKLVDREKVRKLLQPQTPTKSAAPQGKSSPTLSNAQAAQASGKTAAKFLSDEESKAEAAKLLRWDD